MYTWSVHLAEVLCLQTLQAFEYCHNLFAFGSQQSKRKCLLLRTLRRITDTRQLFSCYSCSVLRLLLLACCCCFVPAAFLSGWPAAAAEGGSWEQCALLSWLSNSPLDTSQVSKNMLAVVAILVRHHSHICAKYMWPCGYVIYFLTLWSAPLGDRSLFLAKKERRFCNEYIFQTLKERIQFQSYIG